MRISGQKWLTGLLERLNGRRADGDRPRLPARTRDSNASIADEGGFRFSHYVRAFLDGTTDCVFFLDRDWRFAFLNKCATDELRCGPHLIGTSIWEAFPKVLGTPFEEHYRRAMAERSPQIFEAYFPPLSTWYEVHTVPAEDGLTVIFRNINARRAAAEALRQRERQLATVFRQTVVGILHRDLDRRVLMVNQRYCEIAGRSKDELEGLSVWDFTHPDDVGWNIALFDEHMKTGEPFQIEKRYLRPDGSAVWCAVNVSFVRDDSGKIVSMITLAEDISARKAAEEKLSESRSLLQVVIDSVQDLIFVKDREGRFVFTNRQLTEGFGPIEGQSVHNLFSEDLAEDYQKADRQVLTTGEPSIVEEVLPIRGESRVFQTVKVPWRQEDQIVGVIGVSRDLTDRIEAEAELRESRRQLATLINNLPGLVYRCEVEAPWPYSFISEGAEVLTGYSAADFIEQKLYWGHIMHPDDIDPIAEVIACDVKEKRPFSTVYRIITRSGETRWVVDRGQAVYDASGNPVFLEGIINDITVQKQAEERISWSAHHDSLTKLPNRLMFQGRLDEALERSKSQGKKVGLLLLDLDHLKDINDTLGHDAGDVVLQTVAERLTGSVRAIDTVARNGGDEFAIILPDIDSEQDIAEIIGPILERLQKPFLYAGRTLDCRASIGASIWPDHAEEAASLLKQADVALYTAKSTGRSRVMIFKPSMRMDLQQRTQMRSNAREAIDARRIVPFYQPKIDLRSGTIAGFETLMRWRNAQAGIELPASIHAAFDDPHLAVAIAQQMHDLVFEDMRRWLDAGIAFGHVAINASAAEFRGAGLAERVLERLRLAGIPTHCLELEITETVFLGRGSEDVERALRTLNAEGVRIALDDFGTGYASLSHLKQFPVDIIKIDRSFVQDLANNRDDTAILQAVVKLGKNLGITTVAEGVETEVQADFLRAQGCDLGQGWLFGKAVPKSQIPELVSSWDPRRHAAPSRRG